MLPPIDNATPAWPGNSGWQQLPQRGGWVAALAGAIGWMVVCVPSTLLLASNGTVLDPWLAAPVVALLAALIGAWISFRRHRRTFWQLDTQGFSVRRGNWWQSETRLPISRVQHLDLKRGPLQRMLGLATLVVHTAGTRMAAVSVSGLAEGDAEELRNHLARQLDDDAL
ncbi:hypothetical protein ABB29_09545 [Pseudoxanthomonas dokdonensis]|uniref:YdbS-like PH domain-containing protein n=2 Tax=Pseudoxanthomonas dokdonensis TaxID=344882 RepID=A0A0R0CSQ9_9GAMM|nr:hypothetical protein ABB29_09545 [Pseudoxanthomonas dokdonensis]